MFWWRKRWDSNPRFLSESLVFKTSSINHSDTLPLIPWCEGPESNRYDLFGRQILSLLRLPVPPPSHSCRGGIQISTRESPPYHLAIQPLYGASGQNRTADTRIFSPLLYRLSYRGILDVGCWMLNPIAKVQCLISKLATLNGFEPSISAVTGRHVRPLHHRATRNRKTKRFLTWLLSAVTYPPRAFPPKYFRRIRA